VLDSLRYVDVQDLATGGDHIPELNDVYVDVALVSRAPHQVSDDPLRLAAADTSARHSVSEFLDRRSRVVLALVGRPGSGKSTVLAHAARRSAHPALGWGPGRRRVPVLLALREHAGSIIADPAISLPAVIRAAVGGAAGREPGDWWERQLRRAGASSCSTGSTKWPGPRTGSTWPTGSSGRSPPTRTTTSWSPPGPSASSTR
jgi:hypothetical protein